MVTGKYAFRERFDRIEVNAVGASRTLIVYSNPHVKILCILPMEILFLSCKQIYASNSFCNPPFFCKRRRQNFTILTSD